MDKTAALQNARNLLNANRKTLDPTVQEILREILSVLGADLPASEGIEIDDPCSAIPPAYISLVDESLLTQEEVMRFASHQILDKGEFGDEKERACWRRVLSALDNLAAHYENCGSPVWKK